MEAAQLLQQLRLGDEKAFETIFRQHYPMLCRFAAPFLYDAESAEEAVQEVMVTVWEKREQLEIATSLKSYLFGAVHKHCLNWIKHDQVKARYRQETLATAPLAEAPDGFASELEQQISRAIQKLPEERRKVFLLSREEGLKYREIADKLGISIKTVENQMGKALRFLREELQDYLVWVGVGLYLLLKNLG